MSIARNRDGNERDPSCRDIPDGWQTSARIRNLTDDDRVGSDFSDDCVLVVAFCVPFRSVLVTVFACFFSCFYCGVVLFFRW